MVLERLHKPDGSPAHPNSTANTDGRSSKHAVPFRPSHAVCRTPAERRVIFGGPRAWLIDYEEAVHEVEPDPARNDDDED